MDREPGKTAERLAASGSRAVTRSAGLVSVATFLSRILGLIRELVVARIFGAGMATDAFNVAFRIPNLLRDLFAEGALSAAFVPAFTRTLTQEGKPAAFLLANRVMGCLSLIVGALCLAGLVLADPLARLMAPGFEDVVGKMALTVTMTRVMMFFLLLVALAAVAMGVLNSLGRFFLPALAPSFLSVGIIGASLLICPFMPSLGLDPMIGLALGVMLGGAGQLLAQIPALWREGWRFRFLPSFSDPGVQAIGRLMLPATVGLAATQFSVFMTTWMASQLVQGSVSWLNYAFRLMQLPIGVFGVAISLASLPAVSRLVAAGRRDEVPTAVSHSLELVLLLNLPAAAGLMVLAEPITRLLYQGGRFSADDTLATALALQAYCIGLFAYSAIKVVVPVFYALGDARRPTVISILSVTLTVTFNLAVMNILGHVGLALGTSLGALFSLTLLLIGLKGHLGPFPSTRNATLRIAGATLIMGLASRQSCLAIETAMGTETLTARLASVAVGVAAGVIAYGCSLAVMRSPELSSLLNSLRRKR